MMFGSAPLGSVPLGESPGTYVPDYFEDVSIFIPLEIKNELELNYITKQIGAFKHNQSLHNDYAILALHQLFMFSTYGFIYSCLRRNDELIRSVFTLAAVRPNERKQLLRISSPFTLSLLNERSVFDMLPVLGCQVTSELAEFKKLVDDRNDLAHCNGQMCVNFEVDVQTYLKAFEKLSKIAAPVTYSHLLDINGLDYGADEDVQVDGLKIIMSNNYISQRLLELSLPPIGKDGLTKRSHSLVMQYVGT